MIIGLTLRPDGSVCYSIVWESHESWHYGLELSIQKDMTKI